MRAELILRRLAPVAVLGLCAALPASAQDQAMVDPMTGPGKVIVRVRTPGGVIPLLTVRMFEQLRMHEIPAFTQDAAMTLFQDVPPGNYVVEARAPGYETARDEVAVLPRSVIQAVLLLRPEGSGASPPGPPVLTPKARKELEKVHEALQKKNVKEARARQDKVSKMAPGHPDVLYYSGLVALAAQDAAAAKKHLQAALAMLPEHARAHAALGRLFYAESNYAAAIQALEKALTLPGWTNHAVLASAHYRLKNYESCRTYAQRALELAQGRAPQVQILLAQAYDALGDRPRAIKEIEAFLVDHPLHTQALVAHDLLVDWRGEATKPAHSQPAAAIAVRQAPVASTALPAEPLGNSSAAETWAPAHVDDSRPPLAADVPCSLPDVLKPARRRVVALADNLQSVTAREIVEHAELSADGKVKDSERRNFTYMTSIRKTSRNVLLAEERRFGGADYQFPSQLIVNGLSAMALVFHPLYADDFEITCEGLAEWQRQPVWLLYFRQRPERTSRIRVYTTKEGRFPIALKGRAWVAANSHQIVRLETDLLAPIPEARLQREHLVIEYAPVTFTQRKMTLWLPAHAELFTHLRDKRYRVRHDLSDFTYFAVDIEQKIHDPKDPAKDAPN